LDIITQSQTIDAFPSIRSDLWRIGCGIYLAELVDAFTVENIENQPLFSLLLNALQELSRTPRTEPILRHFELHLLELVGYRPELHKCLNCEAELLPQGNLFAFSGGGVLCPACADTEPVVRPISVNALKVLRFFEHSEIDVARRLRLNPGLSQEVEQLLQGYIRYLLERELKSTEFLERLKGDKALL
jgi:DNA repair protein RecO (recombination protein O)